MEFCTLNVQLVTADLNLNSVCCRWWYQPSAVPTAWREQEVHCTYVSRYKVQVLY